MWRVREPCSTYVWVLVKTDVTILQYQKGIIKVSEDSDILKNISCTCTYNYNILHGRVKTFLYVAIWYLCWPIQHWIEWKLRFWLSMLNEHAYLQKTKRRPGAWHGYNHLLANVTIDYRNLHDIAMQRTMTLKMVSGNWVVWSSVTGTF